IEAVAGDADVALVELLRDGVNQHAAAGGARTAAEDRIGVDVAEFGARLLEAGGAGVGNVVAGHRQILVGGAQAAKCDVEGHDDSSSVKSGKAFHSKTVHRISFTSASPIGPTPSTLRITSWLAPMVTLLTLAPR